MGIIIFAFHKFFIKKEIIKKKMKLFGMILLAGSAFAEWGNQGDHRSNSKNEATCSINNYKTDKSSWITNCPSSCTIMEYLDEAETKINAHWDEIAKKLQGKLSRGGNPGDLHLTLEQLLIKLQEILNSLMTEKEKFEEIQRSYNGADLPGILSEQQIKVNQLSTKKVQLQQTVIELTKHFKEQTGFCKVSFKEYGEQVCDIIHHAKNL